jgi:hypothetical protein
VCGKRRDADDVEFSVEQVVEHTKLGWIVTAYGDICGECHVRAFRNVTW